MNTNMTGFRLPERLPLLLPLLTLPMLLVANLANAKRCKKPGYWLIPLHMGTHLRVRSEGYPMNTNMTGFRLPDRLLRLPLFLNPSNAASG